MSRKKRKPIIGKPLFQKDDVVTFSIVINDVERICKGRISIIDAWGTFEQNEEPSYDIWVDNWDNTNNPCLVKHIRESELFITNLKGG